MNPTTVDSSDDSDDGNVETQTPTIPTAVAPAPAEPIIEASQSSTLDNPTVDDGSANPDIDSDDEDAVAFRVGADGNLAEESNDDNKHQCDKCGQVHTRVQHAADCMCTRFCTIRWCPSRCICSMCSTGKFDRVRLANMLTDIETHRLGTRKN